MSFNKTHINKTVILNLLDTMRDALDRGTVHHVTNRKGQAYLAVRRTGQGFTVTDKDNNNVKQVFSDYNSINKLLA